MMDGLFSFDFPLDSPSETDSKTPSGSQIDVNDSKSAATIQAKREARGSSKKSKSGAAIAEGKLSPSDEAALERLFAPEQWRGVVAGPGQALHVVTGWQKWELEKEEIETLSVGAANCARFFMPMHPKWVALTVFAAAIMQSYGIRTAMFFAERRSNAAVKQSATVTPITEKTAS